MYLLKLAVIGLISTYVHANIVDGASNGSDNKKPRVEEAPPSRVLHIRKLPSEASETEVIALGLPFGKVTNILTLKGKNQVSTDNSFLFTKHLWSTWYYTGWVRHGWNEVFKKKKMPFGGNLAVVQNGHLVLDRSKSKCQRFQLTSYYMTRELWIHSTLLSWAVSETWPQIKLSKGPLSVCSAGL